MNHSQSATFSAHLHGVEESRFLKIKLNIHTALPECFPAPTKVIVPRPHPQLLSLYEVVFSQDAVTELAQASKLHPSHRKNGLFSRTNKDECCVVLITFYLQTQSCSNTPRWINNNTDRHACNQASTHPLHTYKQTAAHTRQHNGGQ